MTQHVMQTIVQRIRTRRRVDENDKCNDSSQSIRRSGSYRFMLLSGIHETA